MPNTREKLIELVVDRDMECNYMDCKKCDYFKVKHCKASMIADHLIANGVTLANQVASSSKQLASKWIPVTERLPEAFTSCIVYRKGNFGGHFSMLRYSPALGWHFYDSEWGDVTVDDVTHWMPLPEPPEGE